LRGNQGYPHPSAAAESQSENADAWTVAEAYINEMLGIGATATAA